MHGMVGLPIINGSPPAQALVEVDGCHSRVFARSTIPEEDTSFWVDSQTLTGIEEIEVILGNDCLSEVGSKRYDEERGAFHIARC